MQYNGLLGGFRLLGDSLGGVARWRGGFSVVSGFEVDLEVELTLVCGNVNGLGVAGALREPMDSNRSSPVMFTLKMVFAALEIFRHILDFKSSMSCLGLG